MTEYAICWDPTVNRAAWAVLMGIVPNGIDPRYTGEWVKAAHEGAPGYNVETADGYTGFGEDVIGLGWHQSDGNGTIWLLVPGFQDVGETTGWTGPPKVVLDGEATVTDAVIILQGMARHLGVQP